VPRIVNGGRAAREWRRALRAVGAAVALRAFALSAISSSRPPFTPTSSFYPHHLSSHLISQRGLGSCRPARRRVRRRGDAFPRAPAISCNIGEVAHSNVSGQCLRSPHRELRLSAPEPSGLRQCVYRPRRNTMTQMLYMTAWLHAGESHSIIPLMRLLVLENRDFLAHSPGELKERYYRRARRRLDR
jgi:hypothetical protein